MAAAAVLAAASSLTTAAATPSHSPPRPVTLGHAGQWLTDVDGRVVIDHGFNLVAKRPPYLPSASGFGADDASFLARHGFTAVRLGVLPEAVEPKPGEYDDRYLDGIASTVHLLQGYGIRSLLDFHQDLFSQRYQGEGLPDWMSEDDGLPAQPQAGFPGNYFAMPALWRAFDNFWGNAAGPGGVGLRDSYTAMWAHVAQRFAGDPAVLGYDLFNEPFPGSNYLSCFPPQGCPNDEAKRLAPFMRAIIDAIHRVDPLHVTFYEPWLQFDYGAPTGLGNFADDMSGMSFHDYCLATVGVPESPPMRAACNSLVEERVVANAMAQAKTSGDALLLSEFGATDNTTELREILSLADSHNIPWLDWAYCACGDPTGNGSAEALVHDPSKPPTGKNVARGVLDTLDEPYPRLVAGTPQGYLYDPRTRAFRFSYSTKPAGSYLRTGAATQIWVGRLHYPHGYRVTVNGGRVVSKSATVLSVANLPGATTVDVVIIPTS